MRNPDSRLCAYFVEVVLRRGKATEIPPLNYPKNCYSVNLIFINKNRFFYSSTDSRFSLFYVFEFQVAKNLDLVYGGGSIGLMGLVSKAVHHARGNVIG